MSKMTPLQEVAAINRVTAYTRLYDALTEIEEKSGRITISTDYVDNNKGILSGRLILSSKDSDRFLGLQDFDLTGVKNLSEYFAYLFCDFLEGCPQCGLLGLNEDNCLELIEDNCWD